MIAGSSHCSEHVQPESGQTLPHLADTFKGGGEHTGSEKTKSVCVASQRQTLLQYDRAAWKALALLLLLLLQPPLLNTFHQRHEEKAAKLLSILLISAM